MSIVCSLCLISLMTGVYCKLTAESEVHIKVYAPYNYIRNGSEVYFNLDKEAEVKTDQNRFQLKVLQYGKCTTYFVSEVPLMLAKDKKKMNHVNESCALNKKPLP